MLITQLKELEKSGIIIKINFNTMPLHIEYSLSEQYNSLENVLKNICDFTKYYADKNNICIPE